MTGTDNSQQQQQRYPCPVCGNTFTRPQHVVRHLRSHTGERPYKCKECGDAFARSDLLSRHVNKCHPALANSGPPQNGKHPKRRACEHCAHTGSRCDSNSPCSSCVEQNVPCSRMPKAISGHHHIPPPLPGYSDPRSNLLPSLGSTIPSMNSGHHRRNLSETSTSDWSSDSSRSRSSHYSQQAGGYGNGGYESNSSLDNLAGGGGGGMSFRSAGMLPSSSSSSSGLPLPLPWVPSSGNLDQSTMTPSQVRAMYGGTLPAGYAHPSQYSVGSTGQLSGPPGSINLPNPSMSSSSGTVNPMDPYNSYAPLVGTTYGGGHHNNNSKASTSSIGTSVGGIGQQSSSMTPAPAWKDYGPPQGSTAAGSANAYGYDPMSGFPSQSVPGLSHSAFSLSGSDEGHHHSSSSNNNNSLYHTTSVSPPSHNNAASNNNSSSSGGPIRPSLPGLDSFMSATFPPLNNVTLSTSSHTNNSNNNNIGAIPSPTTSAPGMAYLFGRGGDRRGSVASSVGSAALSDSVPSPSSLVYSHHSHGNQGGNEPSSPGDMSVASSSRPTTSSGSVVGGYAPPGLPNAFGSLQLRGGADGGADGGEGPNASSGQQANGETDHRKLRQLWSTWLSTPFSSSSEKDAFLMSNNNGGGTTPVNHPGSSSSNSGSMMSAVPSHVYSPSKQGSSMDQMQQQGQSSYSLQKSLSLPAIRTPGVERRSMTTDMPTPRVHNNQVYNLANAEELRRYQEACLARETPSLTLAPPRSRNTSMSNNAVPSATHPFITSPGRPGDSTHSGGGVEDQDGESNSPSPGSIGTGTGSTGSGSVNSSGRYATNPLYVPSQTTGSRPGSSQSTSSQGHTGHANAWPLQYPQTTMSVPEPDPHLAKANMNISGQLGGGQYVSGSASQSGTGAAAARPRPSWKRLASHTLGPELIKSARVDEYGGDNNDDTDGDISGGDGGFEIPRPPSLAGHRKRSNSSPTSSSTTSRTMQNTSSGNGFFAGAGNSSGIVGFHPLPSSASPFPGAHGQSGHHATPIIAHK